jgi:hypothetical protein
MTIVGYALTALALIAAIGMVWRRGLLWLVAMARISSPASSSIGRCRASRPPLAGFAQRIEQPVQQ